MATKKIKAPKVIGKRKWAKMTKRERLVAVAKDVLYRLDMGAFRAKTGTYLRDDGHTYTPIRGNLGDDARDKLAKQPCVGCAKGALLYSSIMLHNQVKMGQLDGWKPYHTGKAQLNVTSNICVNNLKDVASCRTLNAIEDVFEYDWLDDYEIDNDRLRAIMETIILNKGFFSEQDAEVEPDVTPS